MGYVAPIEGPVPTAVKNMLNHEHGPSPGAGSECAANESLYAWFSVPIMTTVLDADITRTLVLKANYLIDV